MERTDEHHAGADESPVLPVSVGKALREARERLGMSVAEVANQIKLAPRQIEALETDDFQRLPEMPFVRGFVRSYARLLHLDAQQLLLQLPDAGPAKAARAVASVTFPAAHMPQRQNLIWLGIALLLAVLVVAFAAWHFTTPPAMPEAVQPEAASAVPDRVLLIQPVPPTTASVPPAVPASPSSTVQASTTLASSAVLQAAPQAAKPEPQPIPQNAALRLVFNAESWTEIRDRDDRILSSQLNQRGSELRLNGQAPFSLVIGQAAAVLLYYRGRQVDLTPYVNASSEVARLTLE